MTPDLDYVRGIFEVHNSSGGAFPDILARDYESRVLAAFRIRMHGARSGVETSMRLWNLLTFEGRRILRIEEFNDEQDALAAAHGRSA